MKLGPEELRKEFGSLECQNLLREFWVKRAEQKQALEDAKCFTLPNPVLGFTSLASQRNIVLGFHVVLDFWFMFF